MGKLLDYLEAGGMSQSGREGARREPSLPDLPRERRLRPTEYPRCRWAYHWWFRLSGFSCGHQLYCAVLYDSGMPLRVAINVAMRKHRFR